MQLQINQEKKELKPHGNYGFPLLVSYERLSYFETGSFLWHWHPEVELTLVMDGEIAYQVNDNLYHLKKGQGLFCNSNMLHSGRGIGGGDCSYLSVTVHPRFLYGYSSSIIQEKYLNPVLKDPALASILLEPEKDWQKQILERIEKIRILDKERPASMELQMQIELLEIWRSIFEHVEIGGEEGKERGRDMERIRTIMEYIQKHYTDKITLKDLADQIHLCRSECCRMFKRCMNETMFEYLLNYRIEKSLELLRQTQMDVTQISGMVGFGNPGYYSRIFRRKMGCTPMEYRKGYSISSRTV